MIDFKNALTGAASEDFGGLVETPPGSTGDTRWDAFIAAVVEDESATRDVPPPLWTNERSRFARPLWYLSDNEALHAWEQATAPGAFVRHGVLAAREELESAWWTAMRSRNRHTQAEGFYRAFGASYNPRSNG